VDCCVYRAQLIFENKAPPLSFTLPLTLFSSCWREPPLQLVNLDVQQRPHKRIKKKLLHQTRTRMCTCALWSRAGRLQQEGLNLCTHFFYYYYFFFQIPFVFIHLDAFFFLHYSMHWKDLVIDFLCCRARWKSYIRFSSDMVVTGMCNVNLYGLSRSCIDHNFLIMSQIQRITNSKNPCYRWSN